MRNYDEEIEQLRKEIEFLDIEKRDKETQLRCVLIERKNKKEKTDAKVVDKIGRPIFKGDRVKVTTSGKFRETSGTVTSIKKWVTFTDVNGVKQVRAPGNLLVQNV